MLYISTRNINDSYTAYRALHEEYAPDGGMYAPFHIPAISEEEWSEIKSRSLSDTVALILNLFFGLRMTGNDIEEVLNDRSVIFQTINQNARFVELWHTPNNKLDYVIDGLYRKMTDKSESPKGWAHIAIQIALLFGLYSLNHKQLRHFDIAIPAHNFADLTSILYAKQMGLPINRIICACAEDGILWDLVNRGEFSAAKALPYTECLIYKYWGESGVSQFLDSCEQKTICRYDEIALQALVDEVYPAVVSDGRADTVISSMHSSNNYAIDRDSALAYGALQDYRACTGVNNQTLLISKIRP